jgi:hypothetical protein
MQTSKEWLERVRDSLAKQRRVQRAEITDGDLHRALDISRQAISNIKHGRNCLDNYTAAKVAEVTGLELGAVIASVEAERTQDNDRRAFWQRLGGTAAAVLFTWWIVGQDTAPALLQLAADASALCVLCKIADPGYLWHLALAAFCIAALWHLATRHRH